MTCKECNGTGLYVGLHETSECRACSKDDVETARKSVNAYWRLATGRDQDLIEGVLEGYLSPDGVDEVKRALVIAADLEIERDRERYAAARRL